MKKQDIKRHLKDYSIFNKRKTTIIHAFASALSVSDVYDEQVIDKALIQLGQDPNNDLLCVYCDKPAETWDHIMAIVKDGKFSGYGHQVGNLLPCCKDCNSKKGNKDWKSFLISKKPDEVVNPILIKKIENHINSQASKIENLLDDSLIAEIAVFEEIQEEVLALFKKADRQAQIIRDKLRMNSEKSS